MRSGLPTTLYEIGWPHCSCGNPWIVTISEVWLHALVNRYRHTGPFVDTKHNVNTERYSNISISISSEVIIFTTRKRSLGQGNIFTPVCHSVHRGGAWSQEGCLLPGGAWWRPFRRLLLRVARILLEWILVDSVSGSCAFSVHCSHTVYCRHSLVRVNYPDDAWSSILKMFKASNNAV